MPGNPYYRSKHWRALRAEALKRDGRRCCAAGCTAPATQVDHVVARPRGVTGPTSADVLGNLRCCCKAHDNQVMQAADGTRRSGGAFVIRGADAGGMPLDPSHPWNKR